MSYAFGFGNDPYGTRGKLNGLFCLYISLFLLFFFTLTSLPYFFHFFLLSTLLPPHFSPSLFSSCLPFPFRSTSISLTHSFLFSFSLPFSTFHSLPLSHFALFTIHYLRQYIMQLDLSDKSRDCCTFQCMGIQVPIAVQGFQRVRGEHTGSYSLLGKPCLWYGLRRRDWALGSGYVGGVCMFFRVMSLIVINLVMCLDSRVGRRVESVQNQSLLLCKPYLWYGLRRRQGALDPGYVGGVFQIIYKNSGLCR